MNNTIKKTDNTEEIPMENIPLHIDKIDYKKNEYLTPSYQIGAKIRNIKERVNTALFPRAIKDLEEVEHIIEMFDILVLKSPYYISAYNKDGNPLMINPTLIKSIGYDEDDIEKMVRRNVSLSKTLYKDENLEKVQKYLKMLEDKEIDGYKNVCFTLMNNNKIEHSILWSTFGFSDGTNIRMGADTTPEYNNFFVEKIVDRDTGNLGENLLVTEQSENVYKTLKNLVNTKNGSFCYRKEDTQRFQEDIEPLFKNIRLMTLMIDFIIKEGSVPIALYEGNKPILFNNAFLTISGYSKEQILGYYKRYGEVMSLFYKGEDREDVKNKLNSIDKVHAGGYRDVEFTMTRNPEAGGQRITMAWNTYNWQNNKTLRAARFVRVEEDNTKLI